MTLSINLLRDSVNLNLRAEPDNQLIIFYLLIKRKLWYVANFNYPSSFFVLWCNLIYVICLLK